MDDRRFRADLAWKMKQARIATWGPVQSQCASALRIKQSQISRWESATTLPRLTDLVRFARATGTTVEDLLGGSRSMKPFATQLLLGLEPEAQSVVVDLVEIIRTKTAEASRRQKRYRRKRA
jgi:transcriptional regulator with XRE-family HTH domain